MIEESPYAIKTDTHRDVFARVDTFCRHLVATHTKSSATTRSTNTLEAVLAVKAVLTQRVVLALAAVTTTGV